jgi:hypothetical protein
MFLPVLANLADTTVSSARRSQLFAGMIAEIPV